LEDWTRARNDLAARLKKAHQSEDADAVRALRKPSLVAWAINQLARREERAMRDLLAAGDRLRSVQEDALRGRGGAAEVSRARGARRRRRRTGSSATRARPARRRTRSASRPTRPPPSSRTRSRPLALAADSPPQYPNRRVLRSTRAAVFRGVPANRRETSRN